MCVCACVRAGGCGRGRGGRTTWAWIGVRGRPKVRGHADLRIRRVVAEDTQLCRQLFPAGNSSAGAALRRVGSGTRLSRVCVRSSEKGVALCPRMGALMEKPIEWLNKSSKDGTAGRVWSPIFLVCRHKECWSMKRKTRRGVGVVVHANLPVRSGRGLGDVGGVGVLTAAFWTGSGGQPNVHDGRVTRARIYPPRLLLPATSYPLLGDSGDLFLGTGWKNRIQRKQPICHLHCALRASDRPPLLSER